MRIHKPKWNIIGISLIFHYQEYVTRVPRLQALLRAIFRRAFVALLSSAMPAAPPGTAWLSELPDDLLVLCIDDSMRLGALLSMTSIALATRIRHAARRGLRLVCKCPWQAFEGACKLQVRELVLTQPEFFVTSWKGLWEWLHDMHMVHRVLVNPDLADNVKRLYMSGNENAYTLRSMRANGGFHIATRPVVKRFRPSQLKLTEMNWLVRR